MFDNAKAGTLGDDVIIIYTHLSINKENKMSLGPETPEELAKKVNNARDKILEKIRVVQGNKLRDTEINVNYCRLTRKYNGRRVEVYDGDTLLRVYTDLAEANDFIYTVNYGYKKAMLDMERFLNAHRSMEKGILSDISDKEEVCLKEYQ